LENSSIFIERLMTDNTLCTGDKKIYISKKCYSNLLLDGVAIKILK